MLATSCRETSSVFFNTLLCTTNLSALWWIASGRCIGFDFGPHPHDVTAQNLFDIFIAIAALQQPGYQVRIFAHVFQSVGQAVTDTVVVRTEPNVVEPCQFHHAIDVIENVRHRSKRIWILNAIVFDEFQQTRIIIGEVRGPDAFDMLNAMNTGHEGSLSTIHANSPRDAISRIENMVLMASLDLPDRAIREQTASALDLSIQLARHTDGVRRVTYVTECTGMEGEVITLQDLFEFRQDHIDAEGKIHGEMRPTGIRPSFAERFDAVDIVLPEGLFLARSA